MGEPPAMKNPKKKAKFKKGQVVCVRGTKIPFGLGVIGSQLEANIWRVWAVYPESKERGHVEYSDYTSGELRPLTKKEQGDA